MIKYLVIVLITLLFNGCVVGDAVALPFRVTGAVVNVLAPDAIGNSISKVGDTLDTAIPL